MFSEFVGHESSDEIYTFPPINPRVSIPDISMSPQRIISNSIKEWLEELLGSSSNIEKLAESSLGVLAKGDEDLRIREMVAEEREFMEKYTELTVPIMFSKRFMKVSYEPPLPSSIVFSNKAKTFSFFVLFYIFLYPYLSLHPPDTLTFTRP